MREFRKAAHEAKIARFSDALTKASVKAVAEWAPYTGPGHWPDPGMLPLGRLREDGPPTGPPNTDCRLTPDEQKTIMSLWCIAKCPLMVGGVRN